LGGSDTNVAAYPVIARSVRTGNDMIAIGGQITVPPLFCDTNIPIGHLVIASSSVGGECTDGGSSGSLPANKWIVGVSQGCTGGSAPFSCTMQLILQFSGSGGIASGPDTGAANAYVIATLTQGACPPAYYAGF